MKLSDEEKGILAYGLILFGIGITPFIAIIILNLLGVIK